MYVWCGHCASATLVGRIRLRRGTARRALLDSPEFWPSIEQGLRETIEWYRASKSPDAVRQNLQALLTQR